MSDGQEDALAWDLANGLGTNLPGGAAVDVGRYALHGEIAAGGMATVHLGRLSASAGFSKTVAIKRLHPQYAKDPEFRQMFVDEARIASRIRHPNVVQLLDVVATDGELFLVMEYVHGESLSRLWKGTNARAERIPPKIAVALLAGVLHGLHAAHEAKDDQGEPLGIVHRDVSPQNILIGTDGVARVLDFGIAKAANRAQTTRENEVKGKLPYMAPEQFGKTQVSRRTDIYAASVVLWEVLTGRRLFEADDQGEIFANIMRARIDPPRTIAKDVPADLEEIVMRGLARNPEARFPTARDMALALEEALAPATASTVSAWVEDVARDALAKRGKQLAEVESLPSKRALEDPIPPVAGRSSGKIEAAPRSPAPSPWRSRSREGREGRDAREAETRAGRGVVPSSRPSAPSGPLVMPAPPTPAAPKRRESNLPFVLFILGAAALALFLALPAIVKRSCVSRAAAYGVTLAVDDVELSMRAIRLVGVTGTAAEVPGVVVRVPRLELGLEVLDVTRANAKEVVITLDGPLSSVTEAFGRWDAARGAIASTLTSPRNRVEVGNLHVIWHRPFGEGTRLEAENAQVDIARKDGRKLGDNFEVQVPLIKLTTPLAAFGPWRAEIVGEPRQTAVRVRFDATGAAILTLGLAEGGPRTLSIDIAPSLLSDIGVPLGPRGARMEMSARAALTPQSMVQSTASIAFTGLLLDGSSAPLDAKLEARLGGDATKPLDIAQGALALGPYRAQVTGAVLLSSDGMKCDLTWQSAPHPCDARPPSSLTGTLTIDSKHLGDARVAIIPDGRCSPRE